MAKKTLNLINLSLGCFSSCETWNKSLLFLENNNNKKCFLSTGSLNLTESSFYPKERYRWSEICLNKYKTKKYLKNCRGGTLVQLHE